jgi:hypothetical protein
MTRLILDYDQLFEGGEQVSGVADYVRAYVTVQQGLRSSGTVEVVVRDRTCAKWLRRALEKHGPDQSEIVSYTARTATEEAWGVSIPASVSDKDIADDRLWEYRPTVFPNEAFDDVILRNFYGTEFASPRLPVASLGNLFEWYVPEKWSQNEKIRCVHAAYRRRLELWRNEARSTAESQFVEVVSNDIGEAKLLLERFTLLRSYPADVGMRVIGENLDLLKQLGPNAAGLTASPEAVQSVVPHVGVYLDGITSTVKTVGDIDSLLAPISGQLELEFYKVEAVLRQLTAVDQETVNKIKSKFARLRPEISSELDNLDNLVSPPLPSCPDGLETAEQWLVWATDEYLPRRFWSEHAGHSEVTLDDYSQRFQDWLYTNYLDLQSNSGQSLHRALLRVGEWIAGPDSWLLVLIADNLGMRFLPALQAALKTQGFATTDSECAFASLPTETAVAKKCLLGATSVHADVAALDYASLAARWSDAFDNRPVYYVADISKIDDVPAAEPCAVVLNYVKLDEMLHEDQSSSGRTRQEMAKFYFDGLANAIRKWSDDIGVAQNLQIAVVADHGSVLLDSGATNIIDTAFLKTCAEDRHHRFVRLSDAELERFPRNLQQQCFLFPRQKYGLAENYAVAQRYYRFANTGDGCYAHGGLSPEEVVVPVVMLIRTPSRVEMPVITLARNVFRYENPEVIELEVTNPGHLQMEDFACEFEAEGLQSGTAYRAVLKPSAVTRIPTDAKFRKTGRPATGLRVKSSFMLTGQRYDVPAKEFAIVLRSLVEPRERRFR